MKRSIIIDKVYVRIKDMLVVYVSKIDKRRVQLLYPTLDIEYVELSDISSLTSKSKKELKDIEVYSTIGIEKEVENVVGIKPRSLLINEPRFYPLRGRLVVEDKEINIGLELSKRLFGIESKDVLPLTRRYWFNKAQQDGVSTLVYNKIHELTNNPAVAYDMGRIVEEGDDDIITDKGFLDDILNSMIKLFSTKDEILAFCKENELKHSLMYSQAVYYERFDLLDHFIESHPISFKAYIASYLTRFTEDTTVYLDVIEDLLSSGSIDHYGALIASFKCNNLKMFTLVLSYMSIQMIKENLELLVLFVNDRDSFVNVLLEYQPDPQRVIQLLDELMINNRFVLIIPGSNAVITIDSISFELGFSVLELLKKSKISSINKKIDKFSSMAFNDSN